MIIDPIVRLLNRVYASKSFDKDLVVKAPNGIDIDTLRYITSTSTRFNNIINVRSSKVSYPLGRFTHEDGRVAKAELVGVWLLPTEAERNQCATFKVMLNLNVGEFIHREELLTISYHEGKLEVTDSVVTDNNLYPEKILSPVFPHLSDLVYNFTDYCKHYRLCSVFKVMITQRESNAINLAGYLKHPKVKGPGLYSIEINI